MTGDRRDAPALVRYEARTSGPLTVLALFFLVVFGVPIVFPDLPPGVIGAAEALSLGIWAVFAVDLVARVAMTDRKLRYLVRHPIDVLSVAVPMLRPLRVLRVFAAGQVLLTRGRGLVRSGQAIVFAAGLLVLVGALAILDAERGRPGATIETFPDAVWWSMTTVTTVGYGDLVPVTPVGRGVAVALMLVGISVLGAVTAAVAAWFVNASGGTDGAKEPATAERLRQIDDLHRDGLLTEEEHEAARARLLARL